jgi:hypothetical protein
MTIILTVLNNDEVMNYVIKHNGFCNNVSSGDLISMNVDSHTVLLLYVVIWRLDGRANAVSGLTTTTCTSKQDNVSSSVPINLTHASSSEQYFMYQIITMQSMQ